ncbi:MAG: alkaline phosphatase family protein, partial [Gammaproteobacteria bacterium]|nr:alkaline phosphatase family protein [Gammaproteobacteria bacterium]
MPLPDYHGNSIVNLMASVETALGGQHDYAPLVDLEIEQLAAARTIVLLVIDGLGYYYLKDRGAQTNLAKRAQAPLTTVFPATTAAAVTTFLTASAPQQHAHTGWFTYFEEVQSVVAGLPCRVRGSGASISRRTLHGLVAAQPLFQRSNRDNFVLSPESIAFSTFNRHFSRGAKIVPYGNLREMFDYLVAICQRKARNYVYAYWPELDRLGHAYGMLSRDAQ